MKKKKVWNTLTNSIYFSFHMKYSYKYKTLCPKPSNFLIVSSIFFRVKLDITDNK